MEFIMGVFLGVIFGIPFGMWFMRDDGMTDAEWEKYLRGDILDE
jgi:hypothetical protein